MIIRKLNKIIVISIFILIICSLSAVSASNNTTINTNNSINANVSTINEVNTITESKLNSAQYSSSNSDTGSYSDLQKLINNSTNSITLDKNYAYDSATDYNYIHGIIIANNNDFSINGNNYTIDGKNTASILKYTGSGTLTINNLNLINGKSSENGAAIDVTNNGNIKIFKSNLINNSANKGGAVYSLGDVSIRTSNIINNTANVGSAIYAGLASVNYNIILGNSLTNKVIYAENNSSNANFNWWGKNEPNVNSLTNIINTKFFIIATINSYDSVMVNATTPIEVNLNSYTDGKKTYYLGVPLSNEYVIFNANQGTFTEKEGYLNNGTITTIYSSSNTGMMNISATIDDQTVYFLLNVTAIPKNTLLYGDDFEEYFGTVQNFTLKLTDILGKPLIGRYIALNLTRLNSWSKIYYRTTDLEGYAQLEIHLSPGSYTIQSSYNDNKNVYINSSAKNNLKVLKIGLTAENLIINYGEKVNYTVTLIGPNITIAEQKIAVKLKRVNSASSKTYWIETNINGTATLPIGLNKGNYILTATYKNNSVTTSLNITKGYSLTVLNWGTGGDIKKNTALYNYILSTTSRGGIVDEIIDAEKQGTVLIKFGNGNGKTVFINAGIHGNELPSQAAAYQIAEYLSNLNNINGTIYMICSLIPSTAQQSIREYNGVDPNRQADITGSVANKLIQLALSLNVQTFADMHGTKAGGLPGKDVIMAAYSPNAESAIIANNMYDIVNQISPSVTTQIVSYAGEVYPTALQDNVNIAGIPAITGEVICEHSTITHSSTRISYNFQIAFLMYNGFDVTLNYNPN
jgi:predicted deacylase